MQNEKNVQQKEGLCQGKMALRSDDPTRSADKTSPPTRAGGLAERKGEGH
jgi:hypothetical protein